MRIVCISDTHTRHGDLVIPDGDLLLHAGDLTSKGSPKDVRAFDQWLGTLPHPHKVVIAGNHDFWFDGDPAARELVTNAIYLQDQECVVGGLHIWGSPWQPRFFDWAFNVDRGPAIAAKWALIPEGTDILITHGPPFGILDRTSRGEAVGCEDLLAAVRRIRPKLHVFGHIHEAYGREDVDGTIFVNASSCDLSYRAVQPPIVVDL